MVEAINLNENKCMGGSIHLAYRCPKCKRKFWQLEVNWKCKCPHCKAELELRK